MTPTPVRPKPADLAPVYLDDRPVLLMGDPRPNVGKVMAASGKRTARAGVVRLPGPGDAQGVPMGLGDVLDRTEEPTVPIYLTTVEPDSLPGAAEGIADVASQFGQGRGPGLGSAYGRTGTDTAGPGMPPQEGEAEGFGSGAGKATLPGAAAPRQPAPTPPGERMAATLEGRFGREGFEGKAEPEGTAASTGPSGTASEAGPERDETVSPSS